MDAEINKAELRSRCKCPFCGSQETIVSEDSKGPYWRFWSCKEIIDLDEMPAPEVAEPETVGVPVSPSGGWGRFGGWGGFGW